jgi:glycosyltransferase involved in cell wall biosynthesis
MVCGYVVERGRSDIDCLPPQNTLWQRAFRFGVNRVEQITGLEYVLLPWKNQFLTHDFVRQADVVHLHNLHGGFFSPTVLPQLSRTKTVIWSLHDMWPLTGHCYYPDMYDCTRWQTGCGQCPGLRQDDHYPLSVDTTSYLWKRKQSLYAATKATLVAQSQWTMDQIRKSPLLQDKPVRLIPYGVDTEVFKPMERRMAREVLKAPTDCKILFFSAVGLKSPRKGWTYLRDALKKVRSSFQGKLVLMIAGHLDPGEQLDVDIPVTSLGYVTDDRIMMLAYNAADVFVGASLLETFGLVFLEAAACGVPSVGFDTSGVRGVVKHMRNGYLARFRDSEDLANGILLLLNNDERRMEMGEAGRDLAKSEFSVELQARRFVDLYNEASNHSMNAAIPSSTGVAGL